MNTGRLQSAAFLVVSGLMTLLTTVPGDAHAFDFQANAKMMHQYHGSVERAYGLVNVKIDGKGNGLLEVMFSNGSQIEWVKFNARVKFIDAAGEVVREDYVYRWLEAAGAEGAAERRVTRSMVLNDVETVEVDFYLTDVIETTNDEIARLDTRVAYY